MNKICFVIMGYGKKTDYTTGKTFNLDKTYLDIIKPSVRAAGYECVRGDEIQESGLIDKSMYGLLIHSDLVIADITTFNPNAIYELGVRHAAKPWSTIVMKEEGGNIPFDINHTRIFPYTHMGEDISSAEAERCRQKLTGLIRSIDKSHETDSPLFEHIRSIVPYTLPEEDYTQLIKDLSEKEDRLFTVVQSARAAMKNNDLKEAARQWQKAVNKAENDAYFIQQLALCTYKSKSPSEKIALNDALQIIRLLEPDGKPGNDPETLGITGAIYKRLWLIDKEIGYLGRAIKYYEKGFSIHSDYYTGENYALCLDFMGTVISDAEEKIYYKIEARKTREKIIDSIKELQADEDFEIRSDLKWIYAALANCHLALNNLGLYEQSEKKFLSLAEQEWETDTYYQSKMHLLDLKK